MYARKILIILPSFDFDDYEYIEMREIFHSEGIHFVVASDVLGTCTGQGGSLVTCHTHIEHVVVEDFDAVIFIGGSGAYDYIKNDFVLELARDTYRNGILVGAIGLTTVILAEAGILKKHRATTLPSKRKVLEKHQAIYINKDIVVDDGIVTASSPDVAPKFAERIMDML